MRKLILILMLLLIPTMAIAGVDDGILQSYVIDFSKQVGMRNDAKANNLQAFKTLKVTDNADTNFADYCLNLQLDGAQFKNADIDALYPITRVDYGYNDFKLYNASKYLALSEVYNGSYVVYLRNIDGTQYSETLGGTFTKKTGGTTGTINDPLNLLNSSRMFVNPYRPAGGKDNMLFFTVKNGLISSNVIPDSGSNALLISDKYLHDNWPFHSYQSCAEEWKGRLFIGTTTQSVYFSSTLDYTDFTIGSSLGGVINTPDGSNIKAMQSNSLGLFIFTSSGIWLLSGDVEPTSWNFKKITSTVSTYSIYSPNIITCSDIQTIYFIINKTLYALDAGTTVIPISSLENTFIDMNYYNGRIYLFAYYGYLSHYYDMATKSFFATNYRSAVNNMIGYKSYDAGTDIMVFTIGVNSAIRYMSNVNSTNGYTVYEQAYWESCPLSLNNLSNYKRIKRIEIDCDFGGKYNALIVGKGVEYTYKYLSNYTLTDNYDKCYFTVKNPKDDSVIYTKELSVTHDLESFNIKTFTITDALKIPAQTQFKFCLKSYGNLKIRAIRIFYYNYGDYKMSGR